MRYSCIAERCEDMTDMTDRLGGSGRVCRKLIPDLKREGGREGLFFDFWSIRIIL